MILIEAGATTTKVCQILQQQSSEVKLFRGINPNYNSDRQMIEIFEKVFAAFSPDNTLQYYGAGCAKKAAQAKIISCMEAGHKFEKIRVDTDLLASARALAGNKSGQINILGTGSASCLYNGQQIEKIYLNTGFLFGDYGSGFDIGKNLLKAYFEDQLSAEATKYIEQFSGLDKPDLIKSIYATESAKSSIANFAKCAYDLRQDRTIAEVITKCLDHFIRFQIQRNSKYQESAQYFSGSIAYFFKDELSKSLSKSNLSLSGLCKSPIENLIQYHLT